MRTTTNKRALRSIIAATNAAALLVPAIFNSMASADVVSYEQNADGQYYSYADGTQGNYPLDNNWSQSFTTNNKGDETAPSNWSTPGYPDGTDVDVTLGSHSVNDDVSVSVDNLTIDAGGYLQTGPNVGLSITGTLTDNGSILLDTGGYKTNGAIQFNGGTLTGSGTIYINSSSGNFTSEIDGTLTQDAGHTISTTAAAQGFINAAFTNNGTVNATGNTQLVLQTNNMTNNAAMTATSGGALEVNGITLTQAGAGTMNADNAALQIAGGGTISGGTISSTNGGVIQALGGSGVIDNLNNITNTGAIQIAPNTTLDIYGSFTDNGSILVNIGQYNTGAALVFNNTMLNGTGTIYLNANSEAEIDGTLTQSASHTITNNAYGTAYINAALTNNGIISAGGNGGIVLQTNNMTNNGTINAGTAGFINITGITLTQSTTGQIIADNGSVQLMGGGTISGGTLATADGGIIYATGSGTNENLSNVTNTGALQISPRATLDIYGTLTDNGSILVNTGQNNTSAALVFNGGTLTGTGTVYLNGNTEAEIDGTLTQSASHTITNNNYGTTYINAALTNDGTVSASDRGAIILQTNDMTNNGTINAGTAGVIQISGITLTQGSSGQVTADGGTVYLMGGGTISGGTLSTPDGGIIQATGSGTTENLNNVTNNGDLQIAPQSSLAIYGNLVDNGSITVNTGQYNTGASLVFNGGTLSGSGTLYINGNSYAEMDGSLTQDAGHSIVSGAFTRGYLNAQMTNNGVVGATQTNSALQINGTFTNNGTVIASTNSEVDFTTGILTNFSGNTLTGGVYEVDTNSAISLPGSINTNAATIILNGSNTTFNALNALNNNSGALLLENGASFSSGTLTNSGTISIDSASALTINGNYSNNGGLTSVAGSLTINNGTVQINSGKIDLTSSHMIINQGSLTVDQLSTIEGYIKTGYNNGSWTGDGIASSTAAAVAADSNNQHKTALGYAEAGSLGINSFHGQNVNPNSILIAYTFSGDANLDGTVNALDFNALATNYGVQSGSDVWSQGDFNYDGTVDSNDFALLAANYNQVMPSSAMAADATDAVALGAIVPEPTFLLQSMAFCALFSCRRLRFRCKTV